MHTCPKLSLIVAVSTIDIIKQISLSTRSLRHSCPDSKEPPSLPPVPVVEHQSPVLNIFGQIVDHLTSCLIILKLFKVEDLRSYLTNTTRYTLEQRYKVGQIDSF